MKKMMRLTALGVVVMMTATAPALEFIDQADADAYAEEESKIMGAIMERAKKALADNDDVALKEAIFEISYNAIGYAGISVVYFRGFVSDGVHGIPPERAAKVLQDTIRKGLPDLSDEDENKRRRAQHEVYLAMQFLTVLPSAETLALLKECTQSQNDEIRNEATRHYSIMEKIQGQEPPPSTPVSPPSPIVTTTPKPEPPAEDKNPISLPEDKVPIVEPIQDTATVSYTWLYVVIGALLVLGICAVFLFMRKRTP